MDSWIGRLQTAYRAGYYVTEADQGSQTPIPWFGKTCGDCPFWLNSVCRVHARSQDADADTCSYFDPERHEEAARIIEERMRDVRLRWWEWWSGWAA